MREVKLGGGGEWEGLGVAVDLHVTGAKGDEGLDKVLKGLTLAL